MRPRSWPRSPASDTRAAAVARSSALRLFALSVSSSISKRDGWGMCWRSDPMVELRCAVCINRTRIGRDGRAAQRDRSRHNIQEH